MSVAEDMVNVRSNTNVCYTGHEKTKRTEVSVTGDMSVVEDMVKFLVETNDCYRGHGKCERKQISTFKRCNSEIVCVLCAISLTV